MNLLSGVAGAAAAVGTDALTRTLSDRQRTLGLGAGLVIAAVIYPAARRDRSPGAPLLREAAGIVVTGLLAGLAATAPPDRGRQMVAAGWAAHAGFDALHHRGEGSLIPSWYPAMCAGYDLTIAARLGGSPAA